MSGFLIGAGTDPWACVVVLLATNGALWDVADSHGIVESVDHRFEIGWTGCGVAHIRKRLGAGATGVVEREVVTLRRDLDERDGPGSRFVTNEDDVDLIVCVLRIAVVVRHPSALGLAEFGQAEDAKRAAGDLVVDADLGEQDG